MRLGIDLDGVVADFNAGWIRLHREEFGSDIQPELVTTWDGLHELGGFADMAAFWDWARGNADRPSIFRHFDPYPDAIDTLRSLDHAGHEIVIITANPFPLLFPGRLMRRVVALTPLVGDLANRIRPTPPLPYQPMSLRWFRRRIGDSGSVEMISNGLPSTAFNQQVSEYNVIGSRLWRLVRWMELTHPKQAVPLGNYTQISITKT